MFGVTGSRVKTKAQTELRKIIDMFFGKHQNRITAVLIKSFPDIGRDFCDKIMVTGQYNNRTPFKTVQNVTGFYYIRMRYMFAVKQITGNRENVGFILVRGFYTVSQSIKAGLDQTRPNVIREASTVNAPSPALSWQQLMRNLRSPSTRTSGSTGRAGVQAGRCGAEPLGQELPQLRTPMRWAARVEQQRMN